MTTNQSNAFIYGSVTSDWQFSCYSDKHEIINKTCNNNINNVDKHYSRGKNM